MLKEIKELIKNTITDDELVNLLNRFKSMPWVVRESGMHEFVDCITPYMDESEILTFCTRLQPSKENPFACRHIELEVFGKDYKSHTLSDIVIRHNLKRVSYDEHDARHYSAPKPLDEFKTLFLEPKITKKVEEPKPDWRKSMASGMTEHVRPQQSPQQQMINQIALHEVRAVLKEISEEIALAKTAIEKNLEELNPIARAIYNLADKSTDALKNLEAKVQQYQKQALNYSDLTTLLTRLQNLAAVLNKSIDPQAVTLNPLENLTKKLNAKLKEMSETRVEIAKFVKSRLIEPQQEAKELIAKFFEERIGLSKNQKTLNAKQIFRLFLVIIYSHELKNLFPSKQDYSCFDLHSLAENLSLKHSNMIDIVEMLADPQLTSINPRLFTLEDLHNEACKLDSKIVAINKAILAYQQSKLISWEMAKTICFGLFEIEDFKACENIIAYLRTQKHLDSNFPCQINFPKMNEMSFRTFNGMLDLIEDKLARNAVLNIHKKVLFRSAPGSSVLSLEAKSTCTLPTTKPTFSI